MSQNEVEVVVSLTRYQVEIIRLVAERRGVTMEDVIKSFFFGREMHCT